MKKYLLLIILCNVLSGYGQSSAQIVNSSVGNFVGISNSPNVASFGISNGENGISETGRFVESIPLHTISNRDFKFPINIDYVGGNGSKIADLAGSVGLGWSLSNTGVVTLIESKSWISNELGELNRPRYDYLKGDNWSTKSYLLKLLEPSTNFVDYRLSKSLVNNSNNSFQGNVYRFSFNGYSGEVYFDEKEEPKFRSKQGLCLSVKFERVKSLTEPKGDSETESGADGSFLLAKNSKDILMPSLEPFQDKETIIKTNEIYNTGRFDDFFPIEVSDNAVSRITFTDCNGFKYVFGGRKNSIEFSRNGHRFKEVHLFSESIYPISWYLSEIIFPNGENIRYEYKRGSVTHNSDVFFNLMEGGYNGGLVYTQSRLRGPSTIGTLMNPVYLEKITSTNETVTFKYKESKQLKTNLHDFTGFNNCYKTISNGVKVLRCDYNRSDLENVHNFFYHYIPDVRATNFSLFQQMPLQLDKMEVYSNNDYNKRKDISFSYSNNVSERLKLLSINIKGENDLDIGKRYDFKYNRESLLPHYDSFYKDYYGFPNRRGGLIFDASATDIQSKYDEYYALKNSSDEQYKYYELRAPKVIDDYPEILKEIKYPTKRTKHFEYESNLYSGEAKNYPARIDNLSVDKGAGGVRIKSIKEFDNSGVILSSKSYKYVKNFVTNGNLSSGILAYKPIYFDEITTERTEKKLYFEILNGLSFFRASSKDLYPRKWLTERHLIYSEIAEIDDFDGSAIVRKYKNFDNGYHDKPILNYVQAHENILKDGFGRTKEYWKNYDIISMDLERGQLLEESYYLKKNNTLEKVKDIQYTYNDSNTRFDDHIRVINRYDNSLSIASGTLNDTRISIVPISWTYIASQIYTYTPYLKKKTVIDYVGINSIINNESSYVYNDEYKLLTEKTEKRGNKTFKTTYKYPFDFTESEYTGMVKKNIVAPVILEENYINETKVSATKTNYILKTSVVTDPVPKSNNETISDNSATTLPLVDSYLQSIGMNYVPKDIEVQYKNGVWEKQLEFLEYDNMANLLSSKDITGKTTNYFWGYKKTLPIWTIENVSYRTIIEVTGKNAINNLANDSEPTEEKMNILEQELDENAELKAAFKTRYLYDPILGLIYKETPLGLKEYYKYDGFGRLVKVEDGDKNTLIEYEYNYKQN